MAAVLKIQNSMEAEPNDTGSETLQLNALSEPETIQQSIIRNANYTGVLPWKEGDPDYLQMILTSQVYNVAIVTPLQEVLFI